MIIPLGGGYAGGSAPDWRGPVAVILFVAGLYAAAAIGITICVRFMELFGLETWGLGLFFALLFAAMLSPGDRR